MLKFLKALIANCAKILLH